MNNKFVKVGLAGLLAGKHDCLLKYACGTKSGQNP